MVEVIMPHDGSSDRLSSRQNRCRIPKNRDQAGENCRDGHQLRAQPLHSALNGRCLNILVPQRGTGGKTLIEKFMQANYHHHARFHRDPEQGDVADPDGNAEVVAQPPLKDKTAPHSIERGKDQNGSLGCRVEDHVPLVRQYWFFPTPDISPKTVAGRILACILIDHWLRDYRRANRNRDFRVCARFGYRTLRTSAPRVVSSRTTKTRFFASAAVPDFYDRSLSRGKKSS